MPGRDAYTRVGMEIFTSPQTLVNGNEIDDENKRLNPLQDRFRPFMSLKEFSATVGSNGFGTMSYSTAKLSMVLHDKSRLAEIAPFIKADIRGKTRVEVEYGWIHPDGEMLNPQNPNYFADIINGMRKRERYQIPTSTFSFTDGGGVNIELSLVTLGTMDTQYELVGIGEEQDDLKDLRELQDKIDLLIQRSRLSEIAGSDSHGQQTIQGLQIINAVSDGFQSGFRLSPEQRQQFIAFTRNSRNRGMAPDIQELRTALKQLYGNSGAGGVGTSATETEGGLITNVRRKIQQKSTQALANINKFIADPAFNETSGGSRQQSGTNKRDPFLRPRRARLAGEERAPNVGSGRVLTGNNARVAPSTDITDFGGKSASLATIMTSFVGVPLAKAGKRNESWSEVQFIYYTFNENAGYCHGQNISSFEIDLTYFNERYNAFRLDNISRSGNVTLAKFWQFLNQEIIDDIAAPSYELWDKDGALAKPRGRNDEPGVSGNMAIPADEESKHNERLTKLMTSMNHNGEWKPPQLELAIENLKDSNPNSTSSILRVHIYDKTANASEGLNSIMMAARQTSMSISGEGHPVDIEANSGNNGIDGVTDLGQRRTAWREMIQRAKASDIVKEIDGPNRPNPTRYRIKGGMRAIKKFVMNNSAYLIPGAQGSLIQGVSVGSMQDPNATLQMISNPRPSENMNPNGSGDRGLPLYMMPTDVSMDVMGCPLISFTSTYFIDFNTNTSIDDLWMVSGIEHRISEGKYGTNIKFRPVSGYGHYTNYINQLRDMELALQEGGQIWADDNETAETHDHPTQSRRNANRH